MQKWYSKYKRVLAVALLVVLTVGFALPPRAAALAPATYGLDMLWSMLFAIAGYDVKSTEGAYTTGHSKLGVCSCVMCSIGKAFGDYLESWGSMVDQLGGKPIADYTPSEIAYTTEVINEFLTNDYNPVKNGQKTLKEGDKIEVPAEVVNLVREFVRQRYVFVDGEYTVTSEGLYSEDGAFIEFTQGNASKYSSLGTVFNLGDSLKIGDLTYMYGYYVTENYDGDNTFKIRMGWLIYKNGVVVFELASGFTTKDVLKIPDLVEFLRNDRAPYKHVLIKTVYNGKVYLEPKFILTNSTSYAQVQTVPAGKEGLEQCAIIDTYVDTATLRQNGKQNDTASPMVAYVPPLDLTGESTAPIVITGTGVLTTPADTGAEPTAEPTAQPTAVPTAIPWTVVGELDLADVDSGSLGALMITKFPFSIPWDVTRAIKLLAAPAKTPHWEVDFLAPLSGRVGGWKGDTAIKIDFSEYEVLGQLCRWITTIMFCAALAMGTKKLLWTA